MGVLSCLVQEIRGLHKFRPQEMLAPMDLEVGRNCFWDEVVPLHDLVEHLQVKLLSFLKVKKVFASSEILPHAAR